MNPPLAYRVGLAVGRLLRRLLQPRIAVTLADLIRPETPEQWQARMRAVAEADALALSVARHPAGKQRPR